MRDFLFVPICETNKTILVKGTGVVNFSTLMPFCFFRPWAAKCFQASFSKDFLPVRQKKK